MMNRALLIPRPDWRKTWRVRQERIKKEGSEYFTWLVPVIAVGGTVTIEIARQFPRARKYEPLDWIEIANNDAVDVRFILNSGETLPVFSGVIRVIENKPLWTVGIENLDAATAVTAGKIIVSLRREPVTINAWARREF